MSDPNASDPRSPEPVPPAQTAPEQVPPVVTPAPASPDTAVWAPAPAAAPPASTAPPEPVAPATPAVAAPQEPAPPQYAAPDSTPTVDYGPPAAQPQYAAPDGTAAPDYGPPAAQPPHGTPVASQVYAPPAAPPYGAPPVYGAPPSYGAPTPQGPDNRSKVLAIIALVAAGVGFIAAAIPFVTFGSGVFLLAGFVMGLIALIGKRQGGKGFSLAAVIVSVVGWILAIFMVFFSIGLFGQAVDSSITQGLNGSDPGSGSGSGSGADTATDAQDIVVDESAFGRSSYDDGTWWYVVILDNPNDDYVFDYADIAVEALASSGTILDSDTAYATLLSGQTVITGTFYSVGSGEIDSLSVTGPDASEAITSPLEDTGTFTINDLATTSDSYYTTVTGTVSGDFDQDQSYASITVVARDASGQIIGSGWTSIDRLPAGGTPVQFEVDFYDTLPSGTTFEAYASL